MTNSSDPKKRPKDPPLCGGSDLVPDSDGFMMRLLALAFKEAYVLELLGMHADPNFSLRDEYLRIVAERASRRFVLSPEREGFIASTPPSSRTLRLWRHKYIEADLNPLALLPRRPRPNRRAKAPSED